MNVCETDGFGLTTDESFPTDVLGNGLCLTFSSDFIRKHRSEVVQYSFCSRS